MKFLKDKASKISKILKMLKIKYPETYIQLYSLMIILEHDSNISQHAYFAGYINVGCGGKAGYYFSSTCVLVGSFTLFFIDLHRRNLSRHKHTRANGTKHTCSSNSCPQRRRLSFSQEPKNEGPHVAAAGTAGATAAALVLGADIAPAQGIFLSCVFFTIWQKS